MQMVSIKSGIPFLTLCLSAIIFTTTVTCKTTQHEVDFLKSYRLPTDVVPLHYDIGVVVLLDTDEMVYCKCQINIRVINKTSDISLHSQYMSNINSKISLVTSDGTIIDYKYIDYIDDKQMLVIHFKTPLLPGQYVLAISYFYILPVAKMQGLFSITVEFQEANVTNIISLLTINVQSIEAREWLPCWDEPSYRTTFVIRVLYENSFSFWPSLEDTTRFIENDEKIRWRWANISISEEIPASNVMFALSSFHFEPYKDYSIHFRPGIAEYMQFANDVINRIKKSTWFKKIPESDKEIQQIAVPLIEQDTIGKWKVIIYKEILVTYDENTDGSAKKLEIARTIAYAMVHQLIDNAIRLSWWSDLWLQEGLAMLLHAKIVDEIFPHWRFMDLFAVQIQQEALRLEESGFLTSLEYEIRSTAEIKSLFSFLIYIKAPAVLRMIYHTLGSNMEQAQKCFLTKPFSEMNNSWASFEAHRKVEMCGAKYTMEGWFKKTYFPIVRITRDNDTVLLEVTTYNFYKASYGPQSSDWMVPITWTLHSLSFKEPKNVTLEPLIWIGNSTRINITADDWIIVNKNKVGYYRVLYDELSLTLIAQCLQSPHYKKIEVLNRAQIIDDTYHFWRRLQYTYANFIEIVKYMSQEMEYVVWYSMFQVFMDISRFCPYEISQPIQKEMRDILTSLLDKLTYEEKSGEDYVVKLLRQEAARWACTFGALECETQASRLLTEHINNKSTLLPDWKTWTYCQGAPRAIWTIKQKLELLVDTHTHIYGPEHFNYNLCLRKPPFLTTYIFEYFKKQRKDPIYLFYNSIVEYSILHMTDIWKTFSLHNITGATKSKLLFIIISRLYDPFVLTQLKIGIFSQDVTTLGHHLDMVIRNRLEEISEQKELIAGLLPITPAMPNFDNVEN